nr:immunoglobulin light chain junction region [Macaca mulatta]MOX25969.1 immunoglobulin light chain junction region [Macaca mulatta]MOX27365.1 immunoglobulin light chain junction region [Macaca mulatta]
CLQGYLSPFTF